MQNFYFIFENFLKDPHVLIKMCLNIFEKSNFVHNKIQISYLPDEFKVCIILNEKT